MPFYPERLVWMWRIWARPTGLSKLLLLGLREDGARSQGLPNDPRPPAEARPRQANVEVRPTAIRGLGQSLPVAARSPPVVSPPTACSSGDYVGEAGAGHISLI